MSKGNLVINVHFLVGKYRRHNYYFSSVKAVFDKFTVEDIGCTYNYLRHVLNDDGVAHFTKNALIRRSRLL